MKFTKIRKHLRVRWGSLALYGCLFGGMGVLQWVLLGSLVNGYTTAEVQSYQAGLHIMPFKGNPINLPFYGVERILTKLLPNNLLAVRLTSVLVGVLTLIVFCLVLHAWYGRRIAVFGTILLGSSSWFLHIVRSGTPEVLLLGLFVAFACGVWLRQTANGWAVLLGLVLGALLLYVPGMIWFIVPAALWQWRQLDRIFMKRLWQVSVGALLLLAIIAPLAWAMYHTPSLYKTLLGFPSAGWPKPLTVLHNLATVPSRLAWHNSGTPGTWLGTLPLLDIASAALFVFGAYAFVRQWRLARTKLLLVVFVMGSLLASMDVGVSLSVLVPFVYVVAAAGVDFLLARWFAVFPRNPIAGKLALTMMSLVVGIACVYNIRAYFVAWPQATITETVFTQHS